MRFFTVIVGLAASVALASFQESDFPACVMNHGCISQAEMHSSCDPADTNNICLCKDDYFLRTSTTCIQNYCSTEDLATAANLALKLCKAAGVDISTNLASQPTSTATSTSAASAATTSAAASAATASATPTGNAAASTVVGKGMMVGGFVVAAVILAILYHQSLPARPLNRLQQQQHPSNMRFSVVIIALAVSVASASFLAERQLRFPSCVIPCLSNADLGLCSDTDYACLCVNDTYLRATTICGQNTCSPEDFATASQLAQKICKAAGVDISSNPATHPDIATKNAATGLVVSQGIMVGGFVTAAVVLAL
ncbi:hypothetical protein FS837_009496 [Tulasnella sp. UAMH 9824]|nr:hypothetical protein FS837_009496 [Tulasnella sp. UAMH 9824]